MPGGLNAILFHAFIAVSLSVHSHNQKTAGLQPILKPVAVARSASGGVAICDTLCTSGFVDDVMFSCHGSNGQNQARRYVSKKFARWRYQSDIVWWSSSECGTGGEICD